MLLSQSVFRLAGKSVWSAILKQASVFQVLGLLKNIAEQLFASLQVRKDKRRFLVRGHTDERIHEYLLVPRSEKPQN
jgi:hypothetical protein